MKAITWDDLQKPVEPGDEYILSTGEALPLCSEAELKRLEKSLQRRLTLFNKQNGRCVMDESTKAAPIDEELIKRERERRLKLQTVSFCGLVFYVESSWRVHEGKYPSKLHVPHHLRKRAVEIQPEPVKGWRMENGEQVHYEIPREPYWAVRETVYVLSRDATFTATACTARGEKQRITMRRTELMECIGRGAIHTNADDPHTPWKVAEDADV